MWFRRLPFFRTRLPGRAFPLWALALLLVGAGPASPEPGQRIVPLDEDVYRYLRSMALEAGVLPPSTSFPYPMAEMRSELGRILPELLERAGSTGSSVPFPPVSEAAGSAWEGIRRYLNQKPFYAEQDRGSAVSGRREPVAGEPVGGGSGGNPSGQGSPADGESGGQGFLFYPDLRINLEGYAHTNREYNGWAFAFHDRKPFFGLLLDTSFLDSLSLYIDLTAQKDPFQVEGDPDNHTSILTNPSQFDLNMPYRAGASVGGAHWNLWLGRDLLSWGNGRSGNLLLSDADLYHEGVRFTTWWDRFKFTFLLLGLESWRMETDEEGNPYPWPDDPEPDPFKMFLAHRLELALRPNLRLTLNESIVYGGKYPDLRVFNPLVLYHNFYIKEWANSLMSLELDWVPFRGVYLYGQYAQDQLSTLFEKDTYGKDEEPNAMGYLVGFELQRAVGRGSLARSRSRKEGAMAAGTQPVGPQEGPSGRAWLRGGYEFVKTDPWLYIRETPYVSFVSTRRVHSEARKTVLGEKNYYFLHTPIGYPYGPDVVVNTFWVSYEVPETYRITLEYTLIFEGENDITTRFQTGDAAWDLHTPSGTPDVRNILTLGVFYTVSPKILVFLEPSFVYNGNLYHEAGRTAMDFQLVLGVRYRER
ncbi:MAG: hypothetical protein Kow009_12300 [Spirochaetales bacterium]